MDNVRCAHCGFLNFADAGECKRCKARIGVELPGFESYRAPRRRALRWLVALALAAAAGYAVYAYRHRLWYGPEAPYAVAITDSEQFRAPLTVSAGQKVTAPNFTGGPTNRVEGSPDAVYVLEARGLVKFGPVSSAERVTGRVTSHDLRDPEAPPVMSEIKVRYDSARVELTPEGEEAAEAWEDAGDGTWLVPIGSREVFKVLKVGEVEAASGVETCEVEFSWRWVPNELGKAFDRNYVDFVMLPEAARGAVAALNWSTAHAYRATALLEREPGGEWRVRAIRRSENFDRKTELSAF